MQVSLTCLPDGKTVTGLAWPGGVAVALGMPIREAVAQLQSARPPKRLAIRYSEAAPAGGRAADANAEDSPSHQGREAAAGAAAGAVDLAVEVPQEGLRLRFEEQSQRLRVIDVFDLAKLPLAHRGIQFCGPSQSPSFTLLNRLFGGLAGQG